jgi:hypothetical protein
MSYNPNIPQPTNLISQSQGQILANFTAIDSTSYGFSREHITITNVTNGGLHKLATMPDTASVTPGVGYGSYYASKTDTNAGTVTAAVYKSGDATSISILSSIKAWGIFVGSTLAITDGFNFDSVTRVSASPGQYIITLTNALDSPIYGVLVATTGSISGANMIGGSTNAYKITDASHFQIYCKSLTATATVNADVTFAVFQL